MFFLPVFFVAVFVLLIDGVKIFFELFSRYYQREFTSDADKVAVIIPAYNEEKSIGRTLFSLAKFLSPQNIIVSDDGSTDRTVEEARKTGLNVRICEGGRGGKVAAIKRALDLVKTPYVLLWDADSRPGANFALPTSLLEEQTAIAFNVMPAKEARSWRQNLLNDFQSHEYAKSMQIGRRAQSAVESVHCVSGAAGLFKTERLKKLYAFHSGVFPGEDLERTLTELVAGGKIVWVDRLVETDVPDTFRKLAKQRIFGWWPGLYRNLPLFFKLIFKKNVSWKLKFEMAYQILSLISDPLKVFSLIGLMARKNFAILGVMYLIYLLMEIFVYSKMRNGYLKRRKLTLILYPLYNLLQMALRLAAFPVFIRKRFVKMEWKKVNAKVVISLAIFAAFLSGLFPGFAMAESASKLFEFQVKSQIISDYREGSLLRNFGDVNLFAGYQKKYYLELESGDGSEESESLRRLSVGGYFKAGKVIVNPEVRIRENDLTPKIALEKPLFFKPVVGRVSASYSIGEKENFPVIGAGFDYYYGDYHRISLDAIKEFGRKEGIIFVIKNHFERENGWWFDTGGSLTNFGDPGLFGQIGYKIVFIEAGYYKNYDFNNFDRTFVGLGFKFPFFGVLFNYV